jgi:hypothetical protein
LKNNTSKNKFAVPTNITNYRSLKPQAKLSRNQFNESKVLSKFVKMFELKLLKRSFGLIRGKHLDQYVSELLRGEDFYKRTTISQSLSRMFGIGSCSIYDVDDGFYNRIYESARIEGGDDDVELQDML